MICYLVRHGKDDDTVRGGWSNAPLTDEGIAQVKRLALQLADSQLTSIAQIFTSDLLRAKQTADILSDKLCIPVVGLSEFRETNNGVLAGMKNELADKRYPGLYWGALEWDEHYPDGESPHEFYDRISSAWYSFKMQLKRQDCNAILVTHGGVINVIQCIENGITYSNKANPFPVGNAEIVSIDI